VVCTTIIAAIGFLAAPTVASAASDTIPGDGTFRVGTDIQPGVYFSKGGRAGYSCYWSRHSGVGSPGDTIDSGLETGQQYVTIAPTDGSFETSHCQPWTRVQ
jgi:hypothetical protein